MFSNLQSPISNPQSLISMPHFDYIIAGGGASGLSLAYHLNQAGLNDKRILLVERAPKTQNDRTWCFWEAGENTFESILYRTWDRLAFYGDGFERVFEIAPYRYKLLRGIDLYQFMDRWLAQQPNIERLYADVAGTETHGDTAILHANGQHYEADWIFNSVLSAESLVLTPLFAKAASFDFAQDAYAQSSSADSALGANATRHQVLRTKHFLLQHFTGWVIETEHDAFDPTIPTLMDFRVPQPPPRDMRGDTRFVYVMPFSPRRALVEYTVFSPAQLNDDNDYRTGLREYIRDVLKLDEYAIHEEEHGVIPMTDAPFDVFSSPRVMNIGTAGGRTKPSTGYTFLRIQEHSRQISQALKRTGCPHIREAFAKKRFRFYDSVLLDVLDRDRREGATVFTELYQRNPIQRIFRFLDERTVLSEDVQLMLSTHLRTFTRAALRVARSRVFPY